MVSDGPPGAPRSRLRSGLPADRPTERRAGTARRSRTRLLPVGLAIAAVAGGLLLAWSHRLAVGADSGGRDLAFWLGLAVFVGPALALTLARATSEPVRTATVAAAALFLALPKYLRAPDRPLFHDELAQYHQVDGVRLSGRLFGANFVPTVPDFPGLHTLTLALWRVSGLSLWQVAVVLLVVLHLVAVFGVRAIARTLGLGGRPADVAGLVYALNPGFLFATSQYAAESLATGLQIWSLAAVLRASTTRVGTRRAAWGGLAVVTGTATAVTDRVGAPTLVGLGVLLLAATIGAGGGSPGHPSPRRQILAPVAVVAAVTAAWLLTVGHPTAHLVGASSSGPLSGWGVIVAGAAALVAGSLAALGGRRLWARRHDYRVRFAVLVAACYPLSLLLLLLGDRTATAAARRSWPISYQLLAPLIGVGLIAVWDRSAGRAAHFHDDLPAGRALRLARADLAIVAAGAGAAGRSRPGRRTGATAITGALLLAMALLVGNAAAGSTAADRLPGPYRSGVDARMQSPEVLDVASWIHTTAGPGARFIASDRYTADLVATFAQADYVSDYPTGELTFTTATPTPAAVTALARERIGYLVIDRRVATAAFAKLSAYPWLLKVLSSRNYDVYRLRPDLAGISLIPAGSSSP